MQSDRRRESRHKSETLAYLELPTGTTPALVHDLLSMENLADVQVSIAVQSALAMGEVVQAGGRLFSFALPPGR